MDFHAGGTRIGSHYCVRANASSFGILGCVRAPRVLLARPFLNQIAKCENEKARFGAVAFVRALPNNLPSIWLYVFVPRTGEGYKNASRSVR